MLNFLVSIPLLAQSAGADVLSFAQFGVAGLMGGLWWWERKYSRQREEELSAAHQHILSQREHLSTLVEALQSNTRAITQFTQVQQRILDLLRQPAEKAD